MARYVLLRIDDDEEADDLLRDVTCHPHQPLLTPSLETPVMVEIVPDVDPSDRVVQRIGVENAEAAARGLRAVLRQSYLRAGELAAAVEAEA